MGNEKGIISPSISIGVAEIRDIWSESFCDSSVKIILDPVLTLTARYLRGSRKIA